jgi:tetratricopeptide (TPR) repeat protein
MARPDKKDARIISDPDAQPKSDVGSVQPETSVIKNRLLRALLPPGILAFITGLMYYPSLKYPFQFDDIAHIAKKFSIRFDDALSRWWCSSRWFGDWLNVLNFRIGRFDPFYYRLCNVTIHVLTGLGLFYLVYALCSSSRKHIFLKAHALLIAFLTSGLFLLHPVQTQTVSYVIQARLEGLASFFIILTLLAYVKAMQTSSLMGKISLFTLTVFLALISCGTKEVVVVLPFLLLLIDWFFVAQEEWQAFKKRFVLFVVLGVGFLLLLAHQIAGMENGAVMLWNALTMHTSTGNNRGNVLTPDAFDVITPWMFCMSEFKVIVHYLLIFLWPFGISVEYDWKIAPSFFSAEVIFPLLLLACIFFFVIRSMMQRRFSVVSFGLLWFFVAVAPRSTIIPSAELVCDYKTYLASIGVLFIVAVALTYLFVTAWALLRNVPFYFLTREAHLIALTCVLLCVGLSAYERNKIWASGVAFWQDNVQKAPNKARSHNNFGVALSEAGRVDESIAEYHQAIALDAHYADPLSNLSVAYSMKGEVDKAIDSLKGAIHICPNYPEAYNNMGTLLLQKKNYADAEQALKIAVQLRPYYGKAYFNLARLYEERGDHLLAWENLKKSTEGDLDLPEVFFKLGQMSLKLQKHQEAAQAFEQIIKRGIANDQVWFNLANAYFLMGNHDKAQAIYERLVRSNPLEARYLYNLAETLFTKNDFTHAYELFRKVTTLPQPVAQAFFRVAHCLERLNKLSDAKTFLEGVMTLNAADDFKKFARNELTRVSLQLKMNEGKGSIKLGDLKKSFALLGNKSMPAEKKHA